jgi:hypothetical protein
MARRTTNQGGLNAAYARGYGNQAAGMQAFSSAFDQTVQPFIKQAAREAEIARQEKLQAEADAKKEKQRLDILAANSIGSVGANYNPEKVPAAMRPSLQNLLFNAKQNAGQLALQADAARKQFGVSSPEYIELQSQLSSQKNIFEAANSIATSQQALTDEYVKKRNMVSNGVAISKPGLLNRMQYVLDPKLRNYEMDWSNPSDPTYITPEGPIKHSELDDYYSKDSEFGGTIGTTANAIHKQASLGKPLSETQLNTYKQSIINALEAGGEARIQSVLHDKLVEGFSLSEGIEAPNYEQGIYDPQLREDIANNILEHYKSVAQAGLNEYNEKSRADGIAGPKPTYAQRLKSAENKANKTRIDNAYKAAIDAYNQGDLKPGAFERVKTLFGSQVDIAPIDIKRGIFAVKYKSAPTDPDFVSATIDLGDEESLATLYDLAGIRSGVDYTELPNFQITKPAGPTVPTQEESRTTRNPLLQ